MKCAIVMACSNAWLPLAGVTCWSAIQSGPSDCDYFIISDRNGDIDLDRFAAKLRAFTEKEIAVCEVNRPTLSMIQLGRHPPSKFYRLAMDHHVPPHYDRVLYLDSDLLVLRTLDPLLKASLHGLPIGAIVDLWYAPTLSSGQHKRAEIGMQANSDYFNSGVILFDWKMTLERDLLGEVRRHLAEITYSTFADQDGFNVVLENKWYPLPLNFNVTSFGAALIATPTIRHFTHVPKPWQSDFRPHDASYREAYRKALESVEAAYMFEPGPGAFKRGMRIASAWVRLGPQPIHALRREIQAIFSPRYRKRLDEFKRHRLENDAVRAFKASHFMLGEDGFYHYRPVPREHAD